jgi:hypothetical protein
MKKSNNILMVIGLLFIFACDDVLEVDISEKLISIIAPVEGTTIEGNAVQFRWNELDGADDYRVQILTDNEVILLDSLVAENIFNYQMNPGAYSWRVRAENFAYTSSFSYQSAFSVIASSDLTGQLISLQLPENNAYFNSDEIDFSWQPISTADSYEFKILDTDENVILEEELASGSISLEANSIREDAQYKWQVKAKNDSSATNFFVRTFYVDTELPASPELNTPLEDETFNASSELTFTWTYSEMGAVQSDITSTLEVSLDANFQSIFLKENTVNTEYTSAFANAETYYWRVKGLDVAGNRGAYSSLGTFVVN